MVASEPLSLRSLSPHLEAEIHFVPTFSHCQVLVSSISSNLHHTSKHPLGTSALPTPRHDIHSTHNYSEHHDFSQLNRTKLRQDSAVQKRQLGKSLCGTQYWQTNQLFKTMATLPRAPSSGAVVSVTTRDSENKTHCFLPPKH